MPTEIMEFYQKSQESSPSHSNDDEPPSMDDDAPVVNVDMSQFSPEPPRITQDRESPRPSSPHEGNEETPSMDDAAVP